MGDSMGILIIIVSIIVILAGVFLYLRKEKKKTHKSASGNFSRSSVVNAESSSKDTSLDNLVLATLVSDSVNSDGIGKEGWYGKSGSIENGTDLNTMTSVGYYHWTDNNDDNLPKSNTKTEYQSVSYSDDDYKKKTSDDSSYYAQTSSSSGSGYSTSSYESSSSSSYSSSSCDSGSSYDSSSSCSSSSSSDW